MVGKSEIKRPTYYPFLLLKQHCNHYKWWRNVYSICRVPVFILLSLIPRSLALGMRQSCFYHAACAKCMIYYQRCCTTPSNSPSLSPSLSSLPLLPPSEMWCLWCGRTAVFSFPLGRSTPPLVLSPHWILGFYPRCAWCHVSNIVASRPSPASL